MDSNKKMDEEQLATYLRMCAAREDAGAAIEAIQYKAEKLDSLAWALRNAPRALSTILAEIGERCKAGLETCARDEEENTRVYLQKNETFNAYLAELEKSGIYSIH